MKKETQWDIPAYMVDKMNLEEQRDYGFLSDDEYDAKKAMENVKKQMDFIAESVRKLK